MDEKKNTAEVELHQEPNVTGKEIKTPYENGFNADDLDIMLEELGEYLSYTEYFD